MLKELQESHRYGNMDTDSAGKSTIGKLSES